MARDGSGVYHIPPGTQGIPNTTIASAKYNTYTSDVEQDLNLPRPIVAGGTGANNAHDAMVALGGEIAMQSVANYDTFPFVSGSFYSLPGATSAPVAGHGFSGICYAFSAPNYMVLEARDLSDSVSPGHLWVRQQTGGVWSAWTVQAGSTADLDAAYVNVAGDTMTGSLTLGSSAVLTITNGYASVTNGAFNPITGTANAAIRTSGGFGGGIVIDDGAGKHGIWAWNGDRMAFSAGGTATWPGGHVGQFQIDKGLGTCQVNFTTASSSPTTGALTVAGGVGVGGALYANNIDVFDGTINGRMLPFGGTLFLGTTTNHSITFQTNNAQVGAISAAGAWNINSTAASTSPTTGALTVAGGIGAISNIITAANVGVGGNTTGGAYYFGNTGTKLLSYDGTYFNMVGGPLLLNNQSIYVGYGGTTGIVQFGNSGTKYLSYDGTNFNFGGGNVGVAGTLSATGYVSGQTVFFTNPTADFYAQKAGPTRSINFYGGGAYNLSLPDTTGLLTYYGNSTVCFTSNFNGDFTITGANATKPGGGAWVAPCDARIKNELGEYTRGLAEISALRPVYYNYKGNDTPEAPAHIKEEDATNKLPLAVPYPNSMHLNVAKAGTRYTGLIAQEVEAVIPEMVTKRSAYIDGQPVDDLRDLDTTPLIFALINAVKELKAEIDALKAAR